MEITQYSYKYSIINDKYWIQDGTVEDHFSVVLGTKTVEISEKYCEQKIEYIVTKMIPQLKEYNSHQSNLLFVSV